MLPTLLLLAALAGSPPASPHAPQSPGFSLDIDAAPIANLTYQLDCMAGFMPCSTDAFKQLWRDQLQWSAADIEAHGVWTELRRKYHGSIQLDRSAAPQVKLGVPLRGPNLDIETKQRIAGFIATDLESYRRLANVAFLADDADRLTQVLAHFLPRFEKWWREAALPNLAPFKERVSELVEKQHLLELFARVSRFYEAELSSGARLPLHLIYRPALGDKRTNGQQLENHSIVEVLQGERPEERLDVIAHELFHYFYSRAPAGRAQALALAFASSDKADSMAAYALLNEVVATTLGNGLVARRMLSREQFDKLLARKDSLYNDPHIDACAKALLESMEQVLDSGKPITSPEFVSAYLKAASKAFGERGAPPAVYLKNMFAVYDPAFGPSRGALREAVAAGSIYSSAPIEDPRSQEDFNDFPLLSGVIMVSPTELEHLAKWEPVLGKGLVSRVSAAWKKAEAESPQNVKSGVVYGLGAGPKRWVWLLIAPDERTMSSLARSFAKHTQASEGLWIPPAPVGAAALGASAMEQRLNDHDGVTWTVHTERSVVGAQFETRVHSVRRQAPGAPEALVGKFEESQSFQLNPSMATSLTWRFHINSKGQFECEQTQSRTTGSGPGQKSETTVTLHTWNGKAFEVGTPTVTRQKGPP